MKKRLFGIGIFILLFSLSLVLASNIVRFSNTVTEITVLEDTQTLLNVTVNNTHQITNITQVNITIPSTFTFTLDTNRTDSPVSTFANTTTVLNWNNKSTGLVENASAFVREFNFNISASTPGKYNITVQTMNVTSNTLLLTNLTVTVNDTTAPATVTFASPSETAYANLSQTNLAVNVSATDNGVLDSVRFRIINSAGTLINSSNYSISAGSRFVNFTGFSDGTYNVTVTVNDTYNNLNTTAVRTVTLDTTAPAVTLTRSSSSTQNKIVVDISYTESGSGVSGSCTHNRGSSASIEGTTFTETSLSCGESISLTIDCEDRASNTGTTTGTFTTEACSTSSGTSSSSGSSTTWTTTFADDNQELSAKGSIERSLKAKERVRVKVSGETHHVGVTSISSNSISVEISSTPQTATLATGESKKFEVTGDNRYDLLVELKGISGGKANLAISSIDEQIPASQADSGQTGSQGNQTGTSDSASSDSAESKTTTIIVSVIVVLIIILLLVWWFARSRN